MRAFCRVPPDTTSQHMEDYFSKFGTITDVYIPINPITKRGKGVAYISFGTPEELEAAMAVKGHPVNGTPCMGFLASASVTSAAQPVPPIFLFLHGQRGFVATLISRCLVCFSP